MVSQGSLGYAMIAGGLTLVMMVLLVNVVFGPIVDTIEEQPDWVNESRSLEGQDHANKGQKNTMKIWDNLLVVGSIAVFFGVLTAARDRGGP